MFLKSLLERVPQESSPEAHVMLLSNLAHTKLDLFGNVRQRRNIPAAVSTQLPEIRDRIKWWNIVPGDKVRIRGDKSNTIQEVYSVNKFANHVFLRGITVVSLRAPSI